MLYTLADAVLTNTIHDINTFVSITVSMNYSSQLSSIHQNTDNQCSAYMISITDSNVDKDIDCIKRSQK